MLGNFSFGGYFKKEAITLAYEFITKELDLKIDYVSVFEGDEQVPEDKEAEEIWRELGVTNVRKFGRADNFWGPTGVEGPCGPTTEIYVDGVEVWNLVFNEYFLNRDGKLESLPQKGIDTGMGFERLVSKVQGVKNIFETDLFIPITDLIPSTKLKTKRIFADHFRSATFLVADGVLPSNQGQGYILRRILRRVIRFSKLENIDFDFYKEVVEKIIDLYGDFYPELKNRRTAIFEVFESEKDKFLKVLETGVKEFNRYTEKGSLGVDEVFNLYQSYGFPFELTEELAKEKGITVDMQAINEKRKIHQETSRAGLEKKFGGHGLILDTGELKAGSEEELKKVLALHTATHLMQRALREVLGPEVRQAGSDITPERTRFDFMFPRKLTAEELKQVEDLVNQKIKEDLPVNFIELPKNEAEKTGALFFFREKYPDMVKVYFVGRSIEEAWSKEFCGGPHVKHTGEIGHFKIVKEESVAAGTRRIRGAVVL
jgi:alanyl-tRNA synthetase